jgi:small conductance mechanosensitive channel
MKLMLAAAVDAASNAPVVLARPDADWVLRFEEATGLPRQVAVWGVNCLVAILILIIGYMIAGSARGVIRKLFAKRNVDPTIGSFVGNFAHAAIMTFVVITALGHLGIDTKTFAAVIAAAGLAIGLALQGGLSNFAAGVLIVLFRPFKAGDFISGSGVEGVVQEVQVFSTTLNTPDNKRVIVPNGSLMAGTITNFTTNGTRRADVQFNVGAGQDLEKAQKVLVDLALSDPRILKEPAPAAVNTKFVDLGVQVELRVWSKVGDHGAVISDLISRGPKALAAAGIQGPDRTVYYQERK